MVPGMAQGCSLCRILQGRLQCLVCHMDDVIGHQPLHFVAFQPLSSKIVCHKLCTKALKAGFFNHVKSVCVEDGYQGVVVGDYSEVVKS